MRLAGSPSRPVSRLLTESIEERRLGGYTEKSQRYITLKGDYVKPKEFSPQDLEKFEKNIKIQNDFYSKTKEAIFSHLKKKENVQGDQKAILNSLEGIAKEDSRYVLSLATQAQLGCSYAGQTAELAIMKLKYGDLEEERELAGLLYNAIASVAPSLIQLTDPGLFRKHNPGLELKDDSFKFTRKNLKELAQKTFAENQSRMVSYRHKLNFTANGGVTLAGTSDIDTNIIAAILHKNGKKDIVDSYAIAKLLVEENKAQDFIKESLQNITQF